MDTVYLDHAATTPLDDRVYEAMLPYLKEQFGNASSVHSLGRKARFAVEDSRERIADCLGAAPGEIIFTSGGTEGDNMAVRGASKLLPDGFRRIITSAAEHKAVLEPARDLAAGGRTLDILEPGNGGVIGADRLRRALTDDTGLVSLMFVNNELGSVSPIRELANVCREADVLFHTDAVQAAGYFGLDADELGADLLSVSGHKLYGPKGIGVLYVKGGTDLPALISGGGQERERRGGTENVPAIVGMARALELAAEEREARRSHVSRLRDRLLHGLEQSIGDRFICNSPLDGSSGSGVEAAPHVLNIAFPAKAGEQIDGEMLLLNMDMKGICVSSGSACTSGAVEPSHVLRAIGLDRTTASTGVRFSLGKDNSADEIDYAVDALTDIVERMKPVEC